MKRSCTTNRLVSPRSFFGLVLCLGIFLSPGAPPAWSQAITGTISGQVTDQQNAVVVGAEVKVTDPTTNKAQSSLTNETGRYIFLNVAPGSYSITVTKTGFSVRRFAAQQVEVGQVLTINSVLEIGSTSTTVEVSASAGSQL